MHGQMIGVITSMYRTASDGSAITGINFALQSQVAHEWLKSHDVAVTLHPLPKAVSGSVAVVEEAASSAENQGAAVSKLTSNSQPSTVSALNKPDSLTKNRFPPVQNILPPSGSPSTLLTPPRPFKDADMFSQMIDKIDAEFEQEMQKSEDDFDKKMEKEFDSW